MKVVVLKDFTRQGKKWKEGQVVSFTNDVAYGLIKKGKVRDFDKEQSYTDSEVE